MSPADMRELARLLALQARADAHEDCASCTHSIGCDLTTAQRMRAEKGYLLGAGAFRHNRGLVCELLKVVGPIPCANFKRHPPENPTP